MNFVVYRIYNQYNHKFQVGSSGQFKSRKRNHLSMLRRGIHTNIHLQRAWNKWGEAAFIWTIESKHETRDRAYVAELKWLDQFFSKSCCYNCNSNATGGPIMFGIKNPFFNCKHTKESKKKMSDNREYLTGSEHRWYGQDVSGSKNPFYGKKHTKETKRKLSLISKTRVGLMANAYKGKYIKLIHDDGRTYEGYGVSISSRKLGFREPSALSSILTGRRKSYKGWKLI